MKINKLRYAGVFLLLVISLSLIFSGLFRNPYSSGVRAADKGDWVNAGKHFQKAFTKDPSLITGLAYAQALIYLDDYSSAKDVIFQVHSKLSAEEKRQFADDLIAWIAEMVPEVDARLNPVFDFAEFLIPYTELLVRRGALDTAFAYLEDKPSPEMPTTSFTADSMTQAVETLALAYSQQGNWSRLHPGYNPRRLAISGWLG